MNDYGLSQGFCKYLAANKIIKEAVKGIFSHMPPEINPPYIHFHVVEVCDGGGTASKPKASLKLQVDFYSQYTGVVELHGVMGHLSRYLDGAILSLTWNKKSGTACFKELNQTYTLLKDDLTRKGSLIYQCLVKF